MILYQYSRSLVKKILRHRGDTDLSVCADIGTKTIFFLEHPSWETMSLLDITLGGHFWMSHLASLLAVNFGCHFDTSLSDVTF